MIMMVMKHILAKWPDAFVGSQPHHELYPGYRLVLRFPIWAWVIWYASIIFTSMFLLEWCCPAEFTIPKPMCWSSDIGAHMSRITKQNSFRFSFSSCFKRLFGNYFFSVSGGASVLIACVSGWPTATIKFQGMGSNLLSGIVLIMCVLVFGRVWWHELLNWLDWAGLGPKSLDQPCSEGCS
jgi:hypothetical protein